MSALNGADAAHLDHLIEGLEQCPLVTAELPGIGGVLRRRPEDFVVEERPLYEPAGEGPHLYLTIRRSGWTTSAVGARLAETFDVPEQHIGWAGLKDKRAVVSQTFSVWLPEEVKPDTARDRVETETGLEVLSAARHRNKLRPGHLIGNRFQILVRDVAADAVEQAEVVASALRQRGLPNYFGQQRFGASYGNLAAGLAILLGRGQGRRRHRALLVSAYQSALFNLWLASRLERGLFQQMLAGDIAKKLTTGGLFTVTDPVTDTGRLQEGEITFTGPLFGFKMRRPEADAAALEAEFERLGGISDEQWRRMRAHGDRRPARIVPGDLSVHPHAAGLEFRFDLPKGAFATTVMAEFMKCEG